MRPLANESSKQYCNSSLYPTHTKYTAMPPPSPPRRRRHHFLRLVLLSLTTTSILAFLFPSSPCSPSLLPRPTTRSSSVDFNTLPRPGAATALAAATGTGNDKLPDRPPVVAIIGHPGSGQTTFARYFCQARDRTAPPSSLPPSLPSSRRTYTFTSVADTCNV